MKETVLESIAHEQGKLSILKDALELLYKSYCEEVPGIETIAPGTIHTVMDGLEGVNDRLGNLYVSVHYDSQELSKQEAELISIVRGFGIDQWNTLLTTVFQLRDKEQNIVSV